MRRGKLPPAKSMTARRSTFLCNQYLRNRFKRHQFAVSAASKDLSVQRLSCEIEGGRQQPKRGGRPPRTRDLTPATLYELQEEADQMRRLLDAFRRNDSDRHQLAPAKCPAKCRELLPTVIEKLAQLRRDLQVFATQIEEAVSRF